MFQIKMMMITLITIIIIIKPIIIIIIGMMPRPARCAPAFTEHRYSKSPDLCTLINPYGYQ